ncbi:MAG: hypothetical protein IT383_24815 [Deltaproteobacteria bacterium]|nr:hypothetical protein [Deltaproteobacteria bacterium]
MINYVVHSRALTGHESFEETREALLREFVDAKEALATRAAEIAELKRRRGLIDESRVRDLTEKLRSVESKIISTNSELSLQNARRQTLKERREEQEKQLREAERAAQASGALVIKRDVAADILGLAKSVLETLEGDYVKRVSERMSAIFMGIVGSDPAFEASVFTGVSIDENYDIVINTHGGRHLDADFELNGASQRALTLSFIWALMEVSGVMVPRIIDTPLGMVSGGVKARMVSAITRPPTGNETPDFQVVLLLTRSEIRDVEELLDERAGVVTTLSCSHHYPEDLVNNWGVNHPVSRACTCTHRQSCRVCARRYDERHGITFRDVGGTA